LKLAVAPFIMRNSS